MQNKFLQKVLIYNFYRFKTGTKGINHIRVRPNNQYLYLFGKTLAANAGGRGFKPHRGLYFDFSHFSLIRVECKELFCKTNINSLKLIKN